MDSQATKGGLCAVAGARAMVAANMRTARRVRAEVRAIIESPQRVGIAFIRLWIRPRLLPMGSFAQRYVKRHAPVRERTEIRPLRWFLSPHFLVRFQGGI